MRKVKVNSKFCGDLKKKRGDNMLKKSIVKVKNMSIVTSIFFIIHLMV